MRKIEKLTLNKHLIDQRDILKKKQMKNLWGGRRGCCKWHCTTDANGTPGQEGSADSTNACWDAAEKACPLPDYGIWIQSDCD